MQSLFKRLAECLAEPWVDEPEADQHPYLPPAPGAAVSTRFFQGAVISAVAHAALLAVLAQFVLEQAVRVEEHLEVTVSEEAEPLEPPEFEYEMAEARDDPASTALSVTAMSMAPIFESRGFAQGSQHGHRSAGRDRRSDARRTDRRSAAR